MKHEELSQHYEGSVASGYDEHRKKSLKWQTEQTAVGSILSACPRGLRIIDIPVGTGRFFEFYKQGGHRVTGVDISEDMLSLAGEHPLSGELDLELATGDIFALRYPDHSFDMSICIRFMNLVDIDSVERSLCELARITQGSIVVGIRHLLGVNELKPYTISGVVTLLRQIRSRLRKKTEGKVIFHRERALRRIFRQTGLRIARRECIERRKDGTDYYIYILEHSGA